MAITIEDLHELIHQTSHGHSDPNAVLREWVKRVVPVLEKAEIVAADAMLAKNVKVLDLASEAEKVRELPRIEDIAAREDAF